MSALRAAADGSDPTPLIERVAVLGAGVMGAQIAALCANAGLEVHLLDLPDGEDPAGRARLAIDGLTTLRPPPLYVTDLTQSIHPGSLEDPAEILASVDWVIEVIVENLDIKAQVLQRIAPFVADHAVLSTNTSGLSIAALSQSLPTDLRCRFLGIHFFNPPRYMKLVEAIPGPDTDPALLSSMQAFLSQRLGKGVVVCRDTPNFIANRLGIFSVVDGLHRMIESGLTVEEVDAATGLALGRPRSATLRLCDLIGLDTLLHVAATSFDTLPPHPGGERLAPPATVQRLVAEGRLGAKSGAGFYRKAGAGIEVLDLQTMDYRTPVAVDPPVAPRNSLGDRITTVWEGEDRLSQFARELLLATLTYGAHCAESVAHSLEDVDRTFRWGFNWEAGPFEIIDILGAGRVREAIVATGAPVPALLDRIADGEPATVYTADSILAPAGDRRTKRTGTESPTDEQRLAGGEVLMETDGVRLVYLGEGAAVVEIRGKLNTLPPAVLQGLQAALAHEAFDILAITGAGAHFSAGADLKYVLQLVDETQWDELDTYLRLFQETTSAVRYASVPVVAAARGLALGGGCELCLTSASRVAAGELRIGLVETKVGVIPGAGGCKEIVRRFGTNIEAIFPTLQQGLMSDNALQARALGFLEPGDLVQLDEQRLLGPALAQARTLLANGWVPPEPEALNVAGPEVLARIEGALAIEADAGCLSAHDVTVARALARTLCGGGDSGLVTESRLLELERESFLTLCGTPATRARIDHMLRSGKPLRN